jgi:hypothetical protein
MLPTPYVQIFFITTQTTIMNIVRMLFSRLHNIALAKGERQKRDQNINRVTCNKMNQ